MENDGGSGVARALDCVLDPSVGGCGVNAAAGTFGEQFKGGVWAMQIEDDGIKAWFFARGAEPSDIASDKPDPSSWPTPVMNFVPGPCDLKASFKKMKMVSIASPPSVTTPTDINRSSTSPSVAAVQEGLHGQAPPSAHHPLGPTAVPSMSPTRRALSRMSIS
jgi:hypothetical protein